MRDVAHLPSPTLNIGHPNRISLQKRPDPVVLGTSDTLKLTFQVTEETTENGVQPHQTFLRFFDSTTGEEGIQPVKVTPSGKAKFELVRSPPPLCCAIRPNLTYDILPQNMAKPPSSLPPSGAAPLRVSLLLGSFVHSPAALDLFDLQIPPSAPAPVHPDESFYQPRPELAHTFRPDPKLPPRIVSAFFAALVLAPWAVLLGLVRVSFVRPWFLCFAHRALIRMRLVVGHCSAQRASPILAEHPFICALSCSH